MNSDPRTHDATSDETCDAQDQMVRQTVARYKSSGYAERYLREYRGGLTPKHIRSRIIAARETAIIGSLLREVDMAQSVVLDVPCGTGKLGGVLGEFPVKIIAADVSLAMMALARDQYRSSQVVEFLKCDARHLSLASKSLDVIVCLRLFQRLPSDTRCAILDEFCRVGRRHLVISYSYQSVVHRVRRAARKIFVREIGSFTHVGIGQIRTELETAGLTIRKVKRVLRGLSSEVIFLTDI